MTLKDTTARTGRRPAEPRSFASWTERAASHAASFGTVRARASGQRDGVAEGALSA